MDGYKRFTRVEKIKFILDNSYIKGSTKEYLNSKFYNEGNIFSQYVSEGKSISDIRKIVVEKLLELNKRVLTER